MQEFRLDHLALIYKIRLFSDGRRKKKPKFKNALQKVKKKTLVIKDAKNESL